LQSYALLSEAHPILPKDRNKKKISSPETRANSKGKGKIVLNIRIIYVFSAPENIFYEENYLKTYFF
jgi:hypothetical protein